MGGKRWDVCEQSGKQRGERILMWRERGRVRIKQKKSDAEEFFLNDGNKGREREKSRD